MSIEHTVMGQRSKASDEPQRSMLGGVKSSYTLSTYMHVDYITVIQH